MPNRAHFAETLMEIARQTFDALPAHMRAAAGRVNTRVEPFAAPDVLAEFDMADPYQLTGLYQGVPLIHESVSYPSLESPTIWLYAEPILAEWRARGNVSLEDLVAHVFIHELGHHFGYSDEEMHALIGEED
ncbi:MAG: metallopeptidase family protein [Hyphomonadaceae bacterium]|nr:metallopeptidase family protein [Hyphomonadaceae bacterium]